MSTKKSILLVEDDESLTRSLSSALGEAGLDLAIEHNGESGLERAKRDHPDLIILDLILPKMEGGEVLKKIREDESLSNVPVIVFTNRSDLDAIGDILEKGAVDFLIKHEWRLDDLVALVQKRLGIIQ